MNSSKVRTFMQLAGTKLPADITQASPELRALAAQLLLSETLEYVIKGLGVTPVVNGEAVREPDGLQYVVESGSKVDPTEMIDGLADVAYTMYWNSEAFSLPLEEAYELVCDNNLEKFVPLEKELSAQIELDSSEWHCGKEVCWPKEVVRVQCLQVEGRWFAVGTDANGKVRKPSTYMPVDLSGLVAALG